MIAVVGATGRMGRELVTQLRAQGSAVAAITRSPHKARDLAALGADVRAADVTDASSIAQALRGATAVVSAVHAILGRGANRSEQVDDAGHRTLIDAAREAGVGHFVYTSALDASPSHPVDFWRTKHRIEEYLKASGLAYTILRPGAFMEMHAQELIGKGVISSGSATILGSGTGRVNFVAVRDVAAVAVRVLGDPAARGTTIDVGGPQNFTQDEVAALYARLAGRALKVRHVSSTALRVLGAIVKPLHPGIARVMLASAATDGRHDAFVPAATHPRYGLRLTSLEEFARGQMPATESRPPS